MLLQTKRRKDERQPNDISNSAPREENKSHPRHYIQYFKVQKSSKMQKTVSHRNVVNHHYPVPFPAQITRQNRMFSLNVVWRKVGLSRVNTSIHTVSNFVLYKLY